MRVRTRLVPFGLVLLASASLALADESTIFAPIAPLSGFHLKLKLIADGLVQPLKAKVAPGEPGRFYVVNQSGQLNAVEIATGAKVEFLNVSSRLVPVGILGPGTFDERVPCSAMQLHHVGLWVDDLATAAERIAR